MVDVGFRLLPLVLGLGLVCRGWEILVCVHMGCSGVGRKSGVLGGILLWGLCRGLGFPGVCSLVWEGVRYA